MTYELSYGECSAIQKEWDAYKERKGVEGFGDAELAMEFIEEECAGVYDTEDERVAVFNYIGCLEERE